MFLKYKRLGYYLGNRCCANFDGRIQKDKDQNPDYVLDPVNVEVYDLLQSLQQPLFGTGNMDIDENYQPFGSYLGSVNSTKHL
jgi:hypothetical protein